MLQEILAGHAFTAGLSESQIVKLASLANMVAFKEDQPILRTGERSDYFYLLLSGSVCVEVTAARAYSSSNPIAWSRRCIRMVRASGPA